ncbi:MAG: hypothetical protein ACU841_08635 [Gammaproteobacteria bacterium]
MAIQKQFVLRYREEGHLRFEIPAQYCDIEVAETLTERLLALDGVYRVKVYRGQRKLSIRYQETVCDFTGLARVLFRIIADLEKHALQEGFGKASRRAKQRVRSRLRQTKVGRWFGEKYGDVKETLQAAKVITKAGLRRPGKFVNDPEKAVIDFFNDILVLFLIRLHWDHITKEWIPKPVKYRYEWMAVFYMIFLLMRSRRPK